ncbi:hypothetical protein ACPCSP_33540 [Streptomyces cinereoruber]|uniref:hypothetical protein n=1 Tax=Streptomyces cinereoruber TaxID=67260 RepID=UPI003C2BEF18
MPLFHPPTPPISGGAAADRIAEALGTPNRTIHGEKGHVTAFVVRQFVDRGLLADLSANPDGTLHHPGQVDQVCRREDLADLVAADTPLGPEQAAARLRVRRADFDHMVRLGRIRPPQSIEVRFGTSRAGAVDVALYTTASVDAVPAEHPEVDWEQLRTVAKSRRSPLAALRPHRREPQFLPPARVPRRPEGRPGTRRRAVHTSPAGSHSGQARPVPSQWKHQPPPGVLRAPMVPAAWRKSWVSPATCAS